jgi:hypothetical protein
MFKVRSRGQYVVSGHRALHICQPYAGVTPHFLQTVSYFVCIMHWRQKHFSSCNQLACSGEHDQNRQETFVHEQTSWFTSLNNCRFRYIAESVEWLGYSLDRQGSIPGRSSLFVYQLPRPDWHWGPPSLLSSDNRVPSPGVKRTGRKADYSPKASAEVKKDTRPHGVMLS